MQRVGAQCSRLVHNATCWCTMQRVGAQCSRLVHNAMCWCTMISAQCSVLVHNAAGWCTMQRVGAQYSRLVHNATCWCTMQHGAQCNMVHNAACWCTMQRVSDTWVPACSPQYLLYLWVMLQAGRSLVPIGALLDECLLPTAKISQFTSHFCIFRPGRPPTPSMRLN